jgi:hypothetical protein
VGCCAEGYRKHQDTFRLPDDLKVGRCWWTMDRLIGRPNSVDQEDGITLEGTYEMTCELEEDSEKCGEPFCDDLVLKGWGQTYIDPNAAILGKPTIIADEACKQDPWDEKVAAPQTPAQKAPEPAQKPSEKQNPVKIASADYYYGNEHETEYYLGVLAEGVPLRTCMLTRIWPAKMVGQ